jgi:hypothetical protein
MPWRPRRCRSLTRPCKQAAQNEVEVCTAVVWEISLPLRQSGTTKPQRVRRSRYITFSAWRRFLVVLKRVIPHPSSWRETSLYVCWKHTGCKLNRAVASGPTSASRYGRYGRTSSPVLYSPETSGLGESAQLERRIALYSLVFSDLSQAQRSCSCRSFRDGKEWRV